jgi:hypothetical protein
MFRLLVLSIISIIALSGCVSITQEIELQNAEINADNSKCKQVMSDPGLDSIRGRTPLSDLAEITLPMLSNRQLIVEEEKAAVELWVKKNTECYELVYKTLRKFDGPNAVNLAKSTDAKELFIIAQLYNKEITWAELNVRRSELFQSFNANLQAMRNVRLQARIADDSARAAAMFSFGQALQNYGNTVYGPEATRAQQIPIQPIPAYQPPKQIDCQTFGNRMSCTQY